MHELIKNTNKIHIDQDFWDFAGVTRNNEKYKIDKNLYSLKFAPLSVLKDIFVQYRFFTHYYIHDLTILIGKLPYGKLKTILAEILYEELGDGNYKDSHPTLYDDFLLSIGIKEESLNKSNEYCVGILQQVQNLLSNESWAYGLGLRGIGGECLCQVYLETMHRYFSVNPEIIKLKNQISWKFWEIHIGEVDLRHQELVRNAMNELVLRDSEIIDQVVDGYVTSVQAWDNYWSQIFQSANNNHEK